MVSWYFFHKNSHSSTPPNLIAVWYTIPRMWGEITRLGKYQKDATNETRIVYYTDTIWFQTNYVLVTKCLPDSKCNQNSNQVELNKVVGLKHVTPGAYAKQYGTSINTTLVLRRESAAPLRSWTLATVLKIDCKANQIYFTTNRNINCLVLRAGQEIGLWDEVATLSCSSQDKKHLHCLSCLTNKRSKS